MRRSVLPLVAVLAVQILVVAAVPAPQLVARAVGEEVTLRTSPVDPYDPLAGYYVTLAYEVARGDQHEAARTRLEDADLDGDARVWVVVAPDEPAWRLVRYSLEPEARGEEIALPARWTKSGLRLDGARRFYVPEAKRREVAEALEAVDQRALVELRVGPDGTLAPVRLRAGDATFGHD